MGTASVLIGRVTSYLHCHHGWTSIPNATTADVGRRSSPLVSGGTPSPQGWFCAWGQAVHRPSCVDTNGWQQVERWHAHPRDHQERPDRKRRRGDASPRSSIDDVRTAFPSSIGLLCVVSHRGVCAATASDTMPRIACDIVTRHLVRACLVQMFTSPLAITLQSWTVTHCRRLLLQAVTSASYSQPLMTWPSLLWLRPRPQSWLCFSLRMKTSPSIMYSPSCLWPPSGPRSFGSGLQR